MRQSSLYKISEKVLSFHHTDRFDSYTSSTYHFNSVKFFLDQFHYCVILGCCLDKFQEQAVFAIVNDLCLEGFGNLKQFKPFSLEQLKTLIYRISFMRTNDVCEINNLNNLDHTVQLFFDLLKSFIYH